MVEADWRERIVSDRAVLAGKPAVRGTRPSVEFLLGLFSAGWSTDEVLTNYPQLTKDDLAAVIECGSRHNV
jgi:uncharacterized protein (DUF433 family)